MTSPDTIICLHGLGRHRFDMALLARHLQRAFPERRVLNFGYHSRHATLEDSRDKFIRFVEAEVPADSRLHFACHSLGSIITRLSAKQLAERNPLGRAVLLGPPNQGSSLARVLKDYAAFRYILGSALSEVAELSIPPATDLLEIGIVAGGTKRSIGYLPFLKGDNDGIVTVEETKLPGAKDHILCYVPHAVLMLVPSVARQCEWFLREGVFRR